MTIRELEQRLDRLEDSTHTYRQGNLATWLSAMESNTDSIVDEERRLYQYGGQLYQLPREIVEVLAED